ncbi:alpha/beta hydrolase [Streptomyces sp. RS10V-4]|uniref:alpha/beta fold hydrolase n=1 Tax=Streptomyces rhizoryzae TaxID=2932493 RepID=UPI00200616BA|nr:alpha/beta hydrolase [Streptomyces rhizoryzae]MCK7625201.1 alpha/beta hydrolase [Streptomyces rhizoryzae]
MAKIVLVPGFWLGAWAWEEVTPVLRAAGHDVHPLTLTGLADRAAEATPDVDVYTHVEDIVALIDDNDLRDVVLVGHSGANLPVTGAADRIPERIARIVYVDAGPLPGGMALIDFNTPQTQEEWRKRVAEQGDGWQLPVPAFDPAADPDNLAGLTSEHLARLAELATPQPFATATRPLDRHTLPPDTHCSVIASTFTPEQVRMLADGGNPVFAPMAEMDLFHLPTGHWPMFSRPNELASLLDEIAR